LTDKTRFYTPVNAVAVIRPTISFAAAIWHTPSEKVVGVAAKLQLIQNKCLRTVLGAYKATPTCKLV